MIDLTLAPIQITVETASQEIVRSAYQAQTAACNAWRTHVVSFLALGVESYTRAADTANTLAKAAPTDSTKLRATIRKSKSVLLKAVSAGVVVTVNMSRGAVVKATTEASATAKPASATDKPAAANGKSTTPKAKPTLSNTMADLIAMYGVAAVTAELEAQAVELAQAA